MPPRPTYTVPCRRYLNILHPNPPSNDPTLNLTFDIEYTIFNIFTVLLQPDLFDKHPPSNATILSVFPQSIASY